MSLEQVERLLDALESTADPQVLANVRALVAVLLEAHGTVLDRMLQVAQEAGIDWLPRLLVDPEVVDLLLLHGLHPDPLFVRAERAVEQLRSDLGDSGAGLTVLRADHEAIELSLPSATPAVAQVVAARLERDVPDVGQVVIVELPQRRLLPVVPG